MILNFNVVILLFLWPSPFLPCQSCLTWEHLTVCDDFTKFTRCKVTAQHTIFFFVWNDWIPWSWWSCFNVLYKSAIRSSFSGRINKDSYTKDTSPTICTYSLKTTVYSKINKTLSATENYCSNIAQHTMYQTHWIQTWTNVGRIRCFLRLKIDWYHVSMTYARSIHA